ncbi:MAG: alpha/beta hydrolase [Spirochaetia bacterium]|nr:alpha/beta hydrolase [Spirochaetia bacterium]
MFLNCNSLFYYPNKKIYSTPEEYNLKYEDIFFQSKDGTKLHGWFIYAKEQSKLKGTIIQFHGNAQNLTSHYRSLVWLTEHGYNLFTFDYRGYGKSEGDIDKTGIREDAKAALEYIRNIPQKKKGKQTIIYGQSLGGIKAIDAFLSFQEKEWVSCVIIESSFASYQKIAEDRLSQSFITWPFQFLVFLLVSEEGSVEDKIIDISPVPLIVIHGQKDNTVPFEFGTDIFKRAIKPKHIIEIPEGGHINSFMVNDGKYKETFLRIIDKTLKIQ